MEACDVCLGFTVCLCVSEKRGALFPGKELLSFRQSHCSLHKLFLALGIYLELGRWPKRMFIQAIFILLSLFLYSVGKY